MPFLLVLMLLLGISLNAVTTVPKVDINRYLGRWYQFAYFPNSFQPKDCGLVVAEYSLNSKGDIVVLNTCYADKEGKQIKKQATGKAYRVKGSSSKLKVSFFWPFKGDYWIVKLDKDYKYSVVSDPKQKYLWILARSPRLDRQSYQEIYDYLKKYGWDMSKLDITGTFE
ncbi:MAG: lipocalin family protein [Candidatus Cloacimonas sp.]|jgi:apolipoprotein D and lipocalin family protein|nr:lipocalin family protein [Candidatus Cloacimonas sp.]